MGIKYRKADIRDLDELVRSRLMVLRAANGLEEGAELSEVESESDTYYRRALADGSHVAYLAYDGDALIGTGGVSFFQVLPTCHNPSGQKAYIMNMYTEPGYRRRGIARRMVELLVAESVDRGVERISLEATKMGRTLYAACGFVPLPNEMELAEERIGRYGIAAARGPERNAPPDRR